MLFFCREDLLGSFGILGIGRLRFSEVGVEYVVVSSGNRSLVLLTGSTISAGGICNGSSVMVGCGVEGCSGSSAGDTCVGL